MLDKSKDYPWESLEVIKLELLTEAPQTVNKKFRRMIYDYETKLPNDVKNFGRKYRLSKSEGFKDAFDSFMNKSEYQRDRWRLKDALGYLKERKPKHSKVLYKYNYKEYVEGIREINRVRKDSTLSKREQHGKIAEVLKKIRNYHVFKKGSLGIKEYLNAWDMAYGTRSGKDRKYIHKDFVKGTKTMLKGVKFFK